MSPSHWCSRAGGFSLTPQCACVFSRLSTLAHYTTNDAALCNIPANFFCFSSRRRGFGFVSFVVPRWRRGFCFSSAGLASFLLSSQDGVGDLPFRLPVGLPMQTIRMLRPCPDKAFPLWLWTPYFLTVLPTMCPHREATLP